MPKGRSETSWKGGAAASSPQTPLQRGTFIDECAEWLVHEPGEVDTPRLLTRTSVEEIDYRCDPLEKEGFAYTHSELASKVRGRCSFCAKLSSHMILANPFSQRCFILLCSQCVVSGSHERE